MKVSEIREMTSEQLNNKLKELKEELFNLRFQLAINQLENTNRIGEVKKEYLPLRKELHKLPSGQSQ